MCFPYRKCYPRLGRDSWEGDIGRGKFAGGLGTGIKRGFLRVLGVGIVLLGILSAVFMPVERLSPL